MVHNEQPDKRVSPDGEHHKLNYQERIDNYIPFAEQVFEEYCEKKGMKYKQLHLNDRSDFENSPIPHWYRMSPLLKSFPDYFVYNDNLQFLVEVKSSNRVKVKDLMHYCTLNTLYSEGRPTKYAIAFCFKKGEVKMLTIDELMLLIPKAKLGYYEDNRMDYYEFTW